MPPATAVVAVLNTSTIIVLYYHREHTIAMGTKYDQIFGGSATTRKKRGHTPIKGQNEKPKLRAGIYVRIKEITCFGIPGVIFAWIY